MQEEINKKLTIYEKLLALKGLYSRKNRLLAERLRIVPEHLSRIKREEDLKGSLGGLVEYIYDEEIGQKRALPPRDQETVAELARLLKIPEGQILSMALEHLLASVNKLVEPLSAAARAALEAQDAEDAREFGLDTPEDSPDSDKP